MIKCYIFFIMLIFLQFAAQANSYYGRVDFGHAHSLKSGDNYYGYENDRFGKATIYNLGLGRQVGENIRAEINLFYKDGFRYQRIEKTEYYTENEEQLFKNIYGGMINLYYNFPLTNKVKTYLTAGIGLARISMGVYKDDLESPARPTKHFRIKGGYNNNLAWQAGIGGIIDLNKNWDLDASYRYTYLGKISSTIDEGNKVLRGKLHSHEFLVGLKYFF